MGSVAQKPAGPLLAHRHRSSHRPAPVMPLGTKLLSKSASEAGRRQTATPLRPPATAALQGVWATAVQQLFRATGIEMLR